MQNKMKRAIAAFLAVLTACAAQAQVAISDLERMPDEQLNAHLSELADEVRHLGQFHFDPPPQATTADRRDETIMRILTLEAEKWYFERYRARHLERGAKAPIRYGVDQSVAVNTATITRRREGNDLIVSLPVRRWSETKCEVLTDSASVGDATLLVFRLSYAGQLRGVMKEIPVTWRLVGQADKAQSFVVRRFPDRTDQEKDASNNTSEDIRRPADGPPKSSR
jgi:hypothetical protein